MSDIEYLRNTQRNRFAEKNYCEKRINSIKQQLKRLERAKYEIAEAKAATEVKENYWKSVPGNLIQWEGDKRAEYGRKSEELTEHINHFAQETDRILDAICDAITSLERKQNSEYNLLGKLKSIIDYLGNEIEKLIN